jgi:hypothetical protein
MISLQSDCYKHKEFHHRGHRGHREKQLSMFMMRLRRNKLINLCVLCGESFLNVFPYASLYPG